MLKIIKVSSDGHTGHLSVHAQVIEKTGPNSVMTGAVETHGIHPQRLREDHDGDLDRWMKDVHREMLARHENRKAISAAFHALQGKILLLDEEKDGTETRISSVYRTPDAEPSGPRA